MRRSRAVEGDSILTESLLNKNITKLKFVIHLKFLQIKRITYIMRVYRDCINYYRIWRGGSTHTVGFVEGANLAAYKTHCE